MKYMLLIAIATLVSCYGHNPAKTGLEGKPIPSFKLLLADTVTWFDTREIPSGRPTVFFLFSPRCPYCRAQMEEIVDDMEKLENIQFYLVTSSSILEMTNFYSEYKLARYPNIILGRDTAQFLADYFEVVGVPFSAIYSKEKRLNEAFIGKIYSSQIMKSAFK